MGGVQLAESSGGLDAVHAGHADVHEDDVGVQGAGLGEGHLAVTGLTDDLDVGLGLQDEPEPGAQQRLVVHQQDADRHVRGPAVGSVAVTAKPPPRRGPALSRPP